MNVRCPLRHSRRELQLLGGLFGFLVVLDFVLAITR